MMEVWMSLKEGIYLLSGAFLNHIGTKLNTKAPKLREEVIAA
jgi:hypothetical protein